MVNHFYRSGNGDAFSDFFMNPYKGGAKWFFWLFLVLHWLHLFSFYYLVYNYFLVIYYGIINIVLSLKVVQYFMDRHIPKTGIEFGRS
ncbi:hypothetical protein LV92_03483 [Arenibacter echinorum]|uniref:Uncharacterized protein n=1 Tax=Arenibacter echinorum TaxID=440515 RepID=A0A327R0M1_9FLAO|nr:hypothetical protein LV92_03483 [Arenibacter echinorum]